MGRGWAFYLFFIASKTLQFAARGEDNVQLLDVGSRELLQSVGWLAADGKTKGAQTIELHLVVVQ